MSLVLVTDIVLLMCKEVVCTAPIQSNADNTGIYARILSVDKCREHVALFLTNHWVVALFLTNHWLVAVFLTKHWVVALFLINLWWWLYF